MRIFSLLWIVFTAVTIGIAACVTPYRSVPFQNVNGKRFQEPTFGDLSSLTLREDIDRLILGAGEQILTLSSKNVTKKTGQVSWESSSEAKSNCQTKGKSREKCKNFITAAYTLKSGKMLVCGTNAFSPSCDYMTVTDETISLDGNQMSVKGTIPFDPSDRFASLMNDDTLFSATSANFLGTEMVFQKHGPKPGQNAIKTEMKQSLLSEPNMISVNLVEASKDSDNGEDDQVFLFFTEKAMEQQPADLLVSRVARVCKSDLGGKKILQKKWSSFIKARLDCPFGDSSALMQDVFLLKSQTNWKDSIFYATFTSNPQHSGASSHSAVCAYRLSDINDVFAGRFLAETRTGGWVPYTGAVPSPRPGSCINDETRTAGFSSSLDLPDNYMTFVIKHPLMEGVVTPIGGKPLLVQSSRKFSKIVVDQVTSPKGQQHQMLLIGTETVIQYLVQVQDTCNLAPVQETSTPVVLVQDASTLVVPIQDTTTRVPVQDNRTLVRTLTGALITLVVFTGLVLIFTLLMFHHLKSRNQGNSEDSPV
uniref:Sema domain-containing protein n=1 Tax=Salarias fasciatus TaxID=181472 RepID=A0A672FSY6_SALFA